MSQEHVERLIGRLLTDNKFRIRASNNLELACREEGFLLSNEEIELMRQADFRRFSASSLILDSGLRRFSDR